MKFLCNQRWDDGERNFVEGKIYDLSEADVKKYLALSCKVGGDISAIGAMVRFDPMDEAGKASLWNNGEDGDLSALRAKAKELKIPAAHLMGKDKLIEAIKKAEDA